MYNVANPVFYLNDFFLRIQKENNIISKFCAIGTPIAKG